MLQVEIIGNIGSDAVIKEFNGTKFISFNVAHNESFVDGQNQKHERTVWVSCLKYGEGAVFGYLKAGIRVFVRGELSAKVYTANGITQAGLNCKVKELQLLGNAHRSEASTQAAEPTPTATTAASLEEAAYLEPSVAQAPDDLPF